MPSDTYGYYVDVEEYKKRRKKWIKWALILILTTCAVLFLYSSRFMPASLDNILEHRKMLRDWVDARPIFSVVIYVLVYIIIVVLTLPLGAFYTVLAGVVWQQPMATLIATIGTGSGATVFFLIMRSRWVAELSVVKKMRGVIEDRLEQHAQLRDNNTVSLLLFFRVVPMLPYWVVNLAAVLLDVDLWTFVWTVYVGEVPLMFIFSQVSHHHSPQPLTPPSQAGAKMAAVLDGNVEQNGVKMASSSMHSVFTWDVLISLLCFGLLATTPTWIKKYANREKTFYLAEIKNV